MNPSSGTSTFGATILDFLDYTSTTKKKVYSSFTGFDNNSSTNGINAVYTGYWAGTSAISSMVFQDDAGYNLSAGTTIALYGIKGE